jgi:tRNA (guanine-N7-)-methyltransferase
LNYLGLEIRPGVSQYAQSRVSRRGLDGTVSFVGCNANVDLDRILTLYRESSSSSGRIDDKSTTAMPVVSFVAIQFPDPHFKKAHAKRRVVTSELVMTLAKFVAEGGGVFLQSDVRAALEAMREKFVDGGDDGDDDDVVGVGRRYFDEWTPPEYDDLEEYGMDNPLGVPTEREGSVLNRGLPVFRTLFRRNSVPFDS